MDPLCNPLTTRPIQMAWEISIAPYQDWPFGCIDLIDCQSGNGSVLTWNWTRSDSLVPLVTPTLTPDHCNEFIHCPKAEVEIATLAISDMKTECNSTLELLEWAHWLRQFTQKWLKIPKYSDYHSPLTTQHEWTIVKYVIEILRLVQA